MKMDVTSAKLWETKNSCDLFIAEQEYFRHGDSFLGNFINIRKEIEKCLNIRLTNQNLYSELKIRKNGNYYNRRMKSSSLNKEIKESFKMSSLNLKFEVTFEEGVFYDSPQTGGFDFALFDTEYNVTNFWNFCFGRRAVFNGDSMWQAELNRIDRRDWVKSTINLGLDPLNKLNGIDLIQNKCEPTIIGEVQFGNWGLVYRDILKAIKIEKEEDIDLLIYITATGNLADYISDGTVNYSKTKGIFEEFKNVLNMPIWLIGIDVS